MVLIHYAGINFIFFYLGMDVDKINNRIIVWWYTSAWYSVY